MPARAHAATNASLRMRVCSRSGRPVTRASRSVPERHEVLDDVGERAGVVGPDAGQVAGAARVADRDRRQAELLQLGDARVVHAAGRPG